jgi:hypothetical protein
MKTQYIAVLLTAINLVLLIVLLAELQPANAQKKAPPIVPVLRAQALEIVDSLGRVRASITIQPPVEVEGKMYPQTALIRLIDPQGKPLVKLSAAENGSGLSLSDEGDGGVLIHARNGGSFLKITNKGKERVLQP